MEKVQITLSFLVTTPETRVSNLGDSERGFPYLSGAGRLVMKDVIMLGQYRNHGRGIEKIPSVQSTKYSIGVKTKHYEDNRNTKSNDVRSIDRTV